MSLKRKIEQRTERRALRVRGRLTRGGHPRVAVFRSARNIYAQLIDDSAQRTLASCSTLELSNISGSKKEQAHAVGLELAKRAKALNVDHAIFDRGSFLYHGRVQALAEGLRAGGLTI